jgi:hypothetical protein
MPSRTRRTRGSIGQLPSGSYRVTVYAGTDPLTGKMRQLRRTAKTYDEAKKELTKLQRQVDEDQHPKSAITVRQTIEQWLDVAALEDTTRERYADLIRLYILPTFGHLQATPLTGRGGHLDGGRGDRSGASGQPAPASGRVPHE